MRKLIVALILFTAACESPEKEIARLEMEKTTACLSAQRMADSLNTSYEPGRNVLEDSARVKALLRADSARQRCELATREYERVGR